MDESMSGVPLADEHRAVSLLGPQTIGFVVRQPGPRGWPYRTEDWRARLSSRPQAHASSEVGLLIRGFLFARHPARRFAANPPLYARLAFRRVVAEAAMYTMCIRLTTKYMRVAHYAQRWLFMQHV